MIETLVNVGKTDRASLTTITAIGEALTEAEIDELVDSPERLMRLVQGLRGSSALANTTVDAKRVVDALQNNREQWSRSQVPIMFEHFSDAYRAGYMQATSDALSVIAQEYARVSVGWKV